MLFKNGFSAEQVEAIVRDFHEAELEPAEVAMLDFAVKIVRQAHRVTQADIDHLRQYGYSEEDITDIVLAVTIRSFYSKTMDALGAEPDEAYREMADRLEPIFEERNL